VRYWDASAIVPLLIIEEATATTLGLLAEDPAIVTWWGTRIECVSALARRGREGALRESDIVDAISRLDALAEAWSEVTPGEGVRRMAVRLLRSQPLRAADALQLAAAIACADGNPASLPFLSLDDRLAVAASKEGFPQLADALLERQPPRAERSDLRDRLAEPRDPDDPWRACSVLS
jgi:predicted nucleic acid-binding protein